MKAENILSMLLVFVITCIITFLFTLLDVWFCIYTEHGTYCLWEGAL